MRWGRGPMLPLRDRKLNGACIVPETVGKVKIIATVSVNRALPMGEALCSSLRAVCYLIVLNSFFSS